MSIQTDVIKLHTSGKTPEEILSILQNSGRTLSPISLVELRFYLRESGLLLSGIDNQYIGPFAELAKSENPDLVDLRNGLINFITHVYGAGNVTLATHSDVVQPGRTQTVAEQGRDMLAGLVQLGVMTTDQRTGFYSLGGGLAFADLTLEQVNLAIAENEARTRFGQAQAAFVVALASLQNGETDLAGVKAAVISGWEA